MTPEAMEGKGVHKCEAGCDHDHDVMWWACDHPERPVEERLTLFKRGCPKCWVAEEAYVRRIDRTVTYMDEHRNSFDTDPSSLGEFREWWFAESVGSLAWTHVTEVPFPSEHPHA